MRKKNRNGYGKPSIRDKEMYPLTMCQECKEENGSDCLILQACNHGNSQCCLNDCPVVAL